MDKPTMVRITRLRRLTPHHIEYTLDAEADAMPGQFCMLWLPGVNEKPMSFSNVRGKAQVTVKLAGPFTAKLFGLANGDMIGFRGPYGNGFKPVKGRVCLVGGGCGTAPLRPLKDVVKGDAVISARTSDELLYENDFKKAGFKVHIATDDGSKGKKAYASQVLETLLEKTAYTCVYACGPEIMLKKVHDACLKRRVPCQLSLERYMKCGIGICGSCTISGMRVCKDGPVFSAKDLKGTEFGIFTRDASGSRRDMDGC
jgi:dihydroorotate dehydrogenase electron transfer subunit